VVIKGKKKVWNLTKKESYDLVDGDFLFTPAGDVHRVKYFEDTREISSSVGMATGISFSTRILTLHTVPLTPSLQLPASEVMPSTRGDVNPYEGAMLTYPLL
jgi:hypothetical protein